MKIHHRRFVAFSFAAAATLLLSACATVTRGTKETLVIETDPPGALVEVDGQRASTPSSIKLSRKFQGPVYITKDGYEPVTVQVNSQVATAGGVGMAGNALIGGLIGAGVDYATGSTNELKPNPIKVHLVRKGEQPQPAITGGAVAPTQSGMMPQAPAMAPAPAVAPAEQPPPVAAVETAAPSQEPPAASPPPPPVP